MLIDWASLDSFTCVPSEDDFPFSFGSAIVESVASAMIDVKNVAG
jgi:hypothetical protein